MSISTSKVPTWIGLALGAGGAVAGYLGAHMATWGALVTIGVMLTAVGDSIIAKNAAIALIGGGLLGGAMSMACNGSLPPNVVQGGVASIETAICIVNVATKDAKAGAPAGQVVADCIQQCGTDAATIARILDANKALMLAQKACP